MLIFYYKLSLGWKLIWPIVKRLFNVVTLLFIGIAWFIELYSLYVHYIYTYTQRIAPIGGRGGLLKQFCLHFYMCKYVIDLHYIIDVLIRINMCVCFFRIFSCEVLKNRYKIMLSIHSYRIMTLIQRRRRILSF